MVYCNWSFPAVNLHWLRPFVLYWILICTLWFAVNSGHTPNFGHALLLGLPLKTSHRFDFLSVFSFRFSRPHWVFLLGFSFAKNRRACVKIEMSPVQCRVWSFPPPLSTRNTDAPWYPTAMSCFAFLLVCRWQSLTTLKFPDKRASLGWKMRWKWARKMWGDRGEKQRGTAALHGCNVACQSALSADSTQYKFLFANRLHLEDL